MCNKCTVSVALSSVSKTSDFDKSPFNEKKDSEARVDYHKGHIYDPCDWLFLIKHCVLACKDWSHKQNWFVWGIHLNIFSTWSIPRNDRQLTLKLGTVEKLGSNLYILMGLTILLIMNLLTRIFVWHFRINNQATNNWQHLIPKVRLSVTTCLIIIAKQFVVFVSCIDFFADLLVIMAFVCL